MKISVYEPSSITLPEESPIHRIFPGQVDYTNDTIFYDVFYKHDNSTIICAGPPLLNLKGALELQEISCNGKQLCYSCPTISKKYDLCNLIVIKVPRLLRRELTVQLSFRFNLFQKVVEISRNNPPVGENGKSLLTLVTLQKDNPLQWIRDWIRWHNLMHGVVRLILYDNGSKEYGYEKLADILENKEDFQTVLVNWDFPYNWNSWDSRMIRGGWTQQGALNHCYLKYGHCGWLLNLDIDEYLVAEDATSLRTYIKTGTQYYLPFRVRDVVGIGPERPLAERSFRDFSYYLETDQVSFQDFLRYPKHPQCWKYACQCNIPLWLSTHEVSHKGFNRLKFQFQVRLHSIIRCMGLIKLFNKIMPNNNSAREIFRVYHFALLSTAWKGLPINPNHPRFRAQKRLSRRLYRDKAYFEAQGKQVIYDDTMIKQARNRDI